MRYSLGGIDLSEAADSPQLRAYAEAVAESLRNEIVYRMEPGPARSGRRYRVPGTGIYIMQGGRGRIKPGTGTYYRASAPGEPPAVATGQYVASFQTAPAVRDGTKIRSGVTNDRRTEDGRHFLLPILENGSRDGRIKPRPHIRPALVAVAARYKGRVVE